MTHILDEFCAICGDLITAAAGQLPHLNAMAAGADDFLAKPFSARELIRRMKKALELRNDQRPNAITVTRQS